MKPPPDTSWIRTTEPDIPDGLCANHADHEPHAVLTGSLAPYWCTADQSQRLPFAAERRRRNGGTNEQR